MTFADGEDTLWEEILMMRQVPETSGTGEM